ncbi:NUMOD3 domain-containing DNA-binding protein [Natronomonas marina]|uniref:NUMOD3 domain-containing DNA-binding protein n=1 Tax=Natronomonas marina TaxID=2961939 RepID=UPI0020C97108|nr:NUMOD3 domain-containing DNA-binding protein [Natronomonas marina]
MPPDYRDPEWLVARYHGDGWTQREMADACDVSPRTIRTWMHRHDVETRDLEGETHPLYGESRNEGVRERIAETMSGREFSEETRRRIAEANRGRTVDESTRREIAESLRGHTRSEETRRRMSESTAGPDNPNWQGGYSQRYGSGWATARERVLERDEACRHCGRGDGETTLEVHHIVPVREFREAADADVSDAHDESNLVTLCERCHPKADHGDLSFESGLEPP